MKILHICRNVPVKNLKGNDIIWKIIENNASLYNHEQKVLFPAEYVPNVPFLPERYSTFSELVGTSCERGYDVLFYKYFRLPRKLAFNISDKCLNFSQVKRYVDGIGCIHAHYIMPDGYVAKKLADLYQVPYLISVRQGDIDRIKKLSKNSIAYKKYKSTLISSSAIISINPSIKRFLKSEFEVDSHLLPHGIESKTINEGNKIRNNKIINVLCVSQFIDRKNISWVIELASKLESTRMFNFTVVGDGELKSHLQSLAGKNVSFTGWLPKSELDDVYVESDIFLLPSENETFGMVYIEAAAKECLIVGKANTGLDGYFTHGKDAFFVNSKEDLMSLFLKISSGCIDWKSIAYNGKKKTKETFVWEVISKRYNDIYNELS